MTVGGRRASGGMGLRAGASEPQGQTWESPCPQEEVTVPAPVLLAEAAQGAWRSLGGAEPSCRQEVL